MFTFNDRQMFTSAIAFVNICGRDGFLSPGGRTVAEWYRSCVGCSPDKTRWNGGTSPAFSVIAIVSTVGTGKQRKQKTSGSAALCSKCLDKLIAGRMPKQLRDGLKKARKALEGAA